MRRRSKQGQVILEELRRLRTHPRSDELFEVVRGRLPRVSLATVYRNLGQLKAEGLALEIYCGDFVRYDGNVAPHDHLLCRSCRRVWDFEGTPGRSVADFTEGGEPDFPLDFAIERHHTVYYGLCAHCRDGHPCDGHPCDGHRRDRSNGAAWRGTGQLES